MDCLVEEFFGGYYYRFYAVKILYVFLIYNISSFYSRFE